MNSAQLREFEEVGLTCLRAGVEPSVARAMCDRLWQEVERKLPMRRADPSTWQRVKPSLTRRLRVSEGLFDPMLSPTVREALDSLLGKGNWPRPAAPGQLLMTPPDATEWTLPCKLWHTDFPAPGWSDASVPGAQLFVLLEDLADRQGGTLFVGGSHRLMRDLPERADPDYQGHSAELRKSLRRRVPWLRDLWRAGQTAEERLALQLDEAVVRDGVPLRILETTGEAGDVFVMHPWLLHAPSPNVRGRMRVVVTERFIANDVKLYGFNRPRAEP